MPDRARRATDERRPDGGRASGGDIFAKMNWDGQPEGRRAVKGLPGGIRLWRRPLRSAAGACQRGQICGIERQPRAAREAFKLADRGRGGDGCGDTGLGDDPGEGNLGR